MKIDVCHCLINTSKLEKNHILLFLQSNGQLGALELERIHSFDEFSNTIEKIQNRPQFQEYIKDGVKLKKYDKEA